MIRKEAYMHKPNNSSCLEIRFLAYLVEGEHWSERSSSYFLDAECKVTISKSEEIHTVIFHKFVKTLKKLAYFERQICYKILLWKLKLEINKNSGDIPHKDQKNTNIGILFFKLCALTFFFSNIQASDLECLIVNIIR